MLSLGDTHAAQGDGEVCGTFGEPSRKWIDLLSRNKISVWQFLPLAPTDSTGSPYSSPSSFAFNPWFLDVYDLAKEGFISFSVIVSGVCFN